MELKEIGIRWEENGELHFSHVYLKSEADKVIARNKFKRCRANAKWCHDMWFLLRFDKEAKKSIFFWRWWNIWLEIADKFKEAK